MGRQERLYAADVATTVEVLPPNIYSGVLFDWQSTRMLKGNQMVLTLESCSDEIPLYFWIIEIIYFSTSKLHLFNGTDKDEFD